MENRTLEMPLMGLTLEATAGDDPQKPVKISITPAYSGGELLNLRGWDLPVIINLATARCSDNMKILLRHDQALLLGHIEKSILTNRDLSLHGWLTMLETPQMKEVMLAHHGGTQWQSSIGMGGQQIDPKNITLIQEWETKEINQQVVTGPLYELNNIEFAEVSLVPCGADRSNSNTVTINAALSRQEGIDMDDLNAIVEPLTKAVVEAVTTAIKEAMAPAEPPKDGNAEGNTEGAIDDKKEVHAEGDTGDEKKEEKKEDGKTVEAGLESVVIGGKTFWADKARAKYHDGETIREPRKCSSKGVSQRTIEAALLMSHGIRGYDGKTVEAMGYTQNEIEQAMEPRNRSMSLHKFYVDYILRDRPYIGSPIERTMAAMNALKNGFRTVDAAGLSTVYDTGIFSNVLNKEIWQRNKIQDCIADQFLKVRTAKDFKELPSYRLNLHGQYQEVAPGEEFPRVKFTDEGYTNKVKKSGFSIALTFEDNVNDDMGVYLDLGDQIADATAYFREELFFKTLAGALTSRIKVAGSNSCYIHDEFGLEGISAADLEFSSKRDATGKYILVTPSKLLIPKKFKAKALQIFSSEFVNETTPEGIQSPSSNIWRSAYQPISSALFNTDMGFDANGWFLFADPARTPCMELAVLEGYDVPQSLMNEVKSSLTVETIVFGAIGMSFFSTDGLVYSDGTGN